jgi:hypothetical protein
MAFPIISTGDGAREYDDRRTMAFLIKGYCDVLIPSEKTTKT